MSQNRGYFPALWPWLTSLSVGRRQDPIRTLPGHLTLSYILIAVTVSGLLFV
jgi:hypothetical protein